MAGLKGQEQKDGVVTLGEEHALTFKVALGTVRENMTVKAEAPPIETGGAGTAANISGEVKDALPTISRSLADIVRTNPLFNAVGGGSGADSAVVSVAGTTNRYNGLQIDGASNND